MKSIPVSLKPALQAGLFCTLIMGTACQGPQPALPRLQAQQASARLSDIEQYYPIQAGRSWTFELSQTQNGQDNSKYKTMVMAIEPLPAENGAERAVLRRVYPGASITPTPSLIKRFADRVELSRYQNPTGFEFLGLQTPTDSALTSRGVNFVTALQLPVQPGNSWEGRVFQGGTETVSVKGLEPVSVPAGNFQALLIEHHLRYENGKEDYLRYWYAPGIGMVKLYEEMTVYFGQWLKFTSTGVLTQYQAGQPASKK